VQDVLVFTGLDFRPIDRPSLMLARIGDVLPKEPDLEVSGEAPRRGGIRRMLLFRVIYG
jgi:hypothetical protein